MCGSGVQGKNKGDFLQAGWKLNKLLINEGQDILANLVKITFRIHFHKGNKSNVGAFVFFALEIEKHIFHRLVLLFSQSLELL